MLRQEFDEIRFFSASEVENTGAKIESVQFKFMKGLDDYRKRIGCSVHLIQNGMTTGKHSSQLHPLGLVADIWHDEERTPLEVMKAAIPSGLWEIGAYWNCVMRSYHLGLSEELKLWGATKKKGEKDWNYGPLIIDPSL